MGKRRFNGVGRKALCILVSAVCTASPALAGANSARDFAWMMRLSVPFGGHARAPDSFPTLAASIASFELRGPETRDVLKYRFGPSVELRFMGDHQTSLTFAGVELLSPPASRHANADDSDDTASGLPIWAWVLMGAGIAARVGVALSQQDHEKDCPVIACTGLAGQPISCGPC